MDVAPRRLLKNGVYLAVVGLGLYALSLYDYLLYHTTLEVFSMVVAAAVLIVAWNGRHLIDNDYLLLVGFAYLSFALIDVPHMLSFPEIGVFRGYGPELTTQLYIAQRFILAASFMAAPWFTTLRLRPYITLGAYIAATGMALGVVFLGAIPALTTASGGPSPARLVIELFIVAMFAASIAAVWLRKTHFDPEVLWLLVAAIVSFIASQIAFMVPANDELVRLFAHYAQGLALFLTYKAVVETAFVRPESLLYKQLADREIAERASSAQYQHVADTLQSALLQVPDRLEGVAIVSRYHSSSEVASIGGDFYDVFDIDNRRVGFTLGDVSGKGLEAATTTAEVKSTVRAYAYLQADPGFVLARTNEVMYRLLSESQFVTALFGVLDTVSGDVVIGSAGHEEPIICVRSKCEFLEAPANLPLGVGYGVQFRTVSAHLFLGDGIVAYTDGVPDARRGDARFGRERLRALVERNGSDPERLADDILDAVMRYTGGRLDDDVAVLGLRLTRPDPESAETAEAQQQAATPVGAGLAIH